jgi:hypothetical protein
LSSAEIDIVRAHGRADGVKVPHEAIIPAYDSYTEQRFQPQRMPADTCRPLME